jgi:hypothetical protein
MKTTAKTPSSDTGHGEDRGMNKKHPMQSRTFDRRTLVKGVAGAAAGASAMSAALAQASTGNAGFYVNRNQDAGELVI